MFAKRMHRRADHLEKAVTHRVVQTFVGISDFIFAYNPVWSSQSVVNWTVSIGQTPKVRLINVDRSNVQINNNRIKDGGEGNQQNITVHRDIAQSARFLAASTAQSEAERYYTAAKNSKHPPPIWLTNVISYTPKLWRGDWRSNPRTLQDAIDNGVRIGRRINVWRFR